MNYLAFRLRLPGKRAFFKSTLLKFPVCLWMSPPQAPPLSGYAGLDLPLPGKIVWSFQVIANEVPSSLPFAVCVALITAVGVSELDLPFTGETARPLQFSTTKVLPMEVPSSLTFAALIALNTTCLVSVQRTHLACPS